MTVVQKGETRSPERTYQLVILALVAALVVAGFVVVWLVSERNKANDEVAGQADEIEAYAAAPEARDAAEEILLEMLEYDHREVEDEFDYLDRFGEKLRERYQGRAVPNLRKIIRRGRLTAEGEVVQSAYNFVDADSATVLAFVRQRIFAEAAKRPLLEEQWTTLKMRRDGDEWLVDDIDLVTVPPPS